MVDGFRRGGLMGVEAVNALGSVGGDEICMHPGREVRPLGFARRKMAHGREDFSVAIAGGEGLQYFVNAGDCRGHASPANC